MIRIVEAYRSKLDYTHPLIRDSRFRENAYAKFACDEILRALKSSGDLPFDITVLDVLEQFVERMKLYGAEHDKTHGHHECFTTAAFIGEFFIEQYWFNGLGEN